MSVPLTRDMLESVFEPGELVTSPEEILGPVTDPDAREVLRTLGLPVWENPWFDMDDMIGERLEPVSEWDWELSDRYDDVPPGADGWISLALFPYDDIVLDPGTGRVHCLPEDAEIYLVNSSLRSFVHFHYLLKAEEPFYDPESQRKAEREITRQRMRETMASVDPAALESPNSCWSDILTSIVDLTHRY
jgi:hypothetical protein